MQRTTLLPAPTNTEGTELLEVDGALIKFPISGALTLQKRFR